MLTNETIALLRAVAALSPRPMTPVDRYGYADAGPDAQIAEGGEDLAALVCEITGEAVLSESGWHPQVVISGDTVEIHCTNPEQNPVVLALRVERLL